MAILMLNRVELCGRLCADPELKATSTGVPCTAITVAVGRGYKNPDGSRDTDFFRIDLYRHHAEYVCRYIKKGESVYIEGSLRLRSYLDPTYGDRRCTLELSVNRVEGVDSRKDTVSGSFDTDEFFEAALRRSYEITYGKECGITQSNKGDTHNADPSA